MFVSMATSRARICKRLRSPGIDSACVVWRANTTNRVFVPARQAGNRFLGTLKGLQIQALFCSASFPCASRLLSARQRGTVPLPLTRTPGQSREETSQDKWRKTREKRCHDTMYRRLFTSLGLLLFFFKKRCEIKAVELLGCV
jgi:hypothetical protein